MRRFLVLAGVLATSLALLPGADARVTSQSRQNGGVACPAASGTTPSIRSLTLGSIPIAVDPTADQLTALATGSLYATTETSCQAQGGDLGATYEYKYSFRINRKYQDVNMSWLGPFGLRPWFLDHEAYADLWGDFSYAAGQSAADLVSAATPIVAVVDLPSGESSTYHQDNYSQSRTEGAFIGDNPVVFDAAAHTVTITGQPAVNIKDTKWPVGLANDFDPLTVSGLPATGRRDWWMNTWGPANGFNLSDGSGQERCGASPTSCSPSSPGGADAHAFEAGLYYAVDVVFMPPTGQGKADMITAAQRGGWFQSSNTPQWSLNYSQDKTNPDLHYVTMGMGNYHQYVGGALVQGALRFMLPDAWTAMAFGVTSQSDEASIRNAVRVERSEAGSTSAVAADVRAAPGGIVIDVGTVQFSSPTYKAKPSGKKQKVVARSNGTKKVVLAFSLTNAQIKAGKGKAVIYANGRKVKTIAVKRGANTVTVTRNAKIVTFTVKVGRTTLGSAVAVAQM